jgi:hypothetical protein
MNIKIRLSIQFTLIVAGILLFFSLLVYYFSYSTQVTKFRYNLYDNTNNIATLFISVDEVDSSLLNKIQKSTISFLEKEGKLVRVTGGAVSNKFKLTYEPKQLEKEKAQKEYKEKIGSCALQFIKDGMTIILDSGTTTLALAKKISESIGGLIHV